MKIDSAELFVLDPDAFVKATIIRYDMETSPYMVSGTPVVYLSHTGKHPKLRTGTFYDKDRGDRCRIAEEGFIEWEDCFGIITNVEVLKAKTV